MPWGQQRLVHILRVHWCTGTPIHLHMWQQCPVYHPADTGWCSYQTSAWGTNSYVRLWPCHGLNNTYMIISKVCVEWCRGKKKTPKTSKVKYLVDDQGWRRRPRLASIDRKACGNSLHLRVEEKHLRTYHTSDLKADGLQQQKNSLLSNPASQLQWVWAGSNTGEQRYI